MNHHSTSFIINGLDDLDGVAAELIKIGRENPVWLFFGSMGAGKTTLIKAICKQLGVAGHVQSPTFSLVNEYIDEAGETLYHFDFYRIKTDTEALDMGIEEYLYSGNFCFIEWPDKIESLWPESYMELTLISADDYKRHLTVSTITR